MGKNKTETRAVSKKKGIINEEKQICKLSNNRTTQIPSKNQNDQNTNPSSRPIRSNSEHQQNKVQQIRSTASRKGKK